MGTYVKAHFEVKIGGVWHHYSQARIEQNYELFLRMGWDVDARGDHPMVIDPIVPPKGFPCDPSIITQISARDDCHDPSWFDANEIVELVEWHGKHLRRDEMDLHRDQYGWVFGNSWGGFNGYRADYPQELEDIRLVFWFEG